VTHHVSESAKNVGDAISIVTVVGTLAEVLPAIAVLLTIVWTAVRIYETDTVQTPLDRQLGKSTPLYKSKWIWLKHQKN
jgi:hypothetical protein